MSYRLTASRVGATVTAIYLLSAVLTGVSVLSKADLITSIVPLPSTAVVALLAIAVLLPLGFVPLTKVSRFVAPAVLLGVWAVVLVVQPKVSALHKQGRGTDQGDCVIVGSSRLLHGQWPYDKALIWSHNPMSCGPTWLALHAPFVATIGYPVTMAIFLTIAATLVTVLRGWRFASVFVTLIGLSPGFWLAYANGNDFVSFGLGVVVVLVLAGSDKRALRVLGAVLSIAVGQARALFVLLPAFALADRRSPGYMKILAAVATVVSVLLLLVYYVWSPAKMVTDGPLHILGKFSSMLGVAVPPVVVAVAFVALSIGLAVLVARFPADVKTLIFSTLILVPLALLSLVTGLRSSAGGFVRAIELWEGVSWLTPLVCISAYTLTDHRTSSEAGSGVSAHDESGGPIS
ncbi:MAG: hypothetical protein WCE30_15050 [Mycobacterium sp.]